LRVIFQSSEVNDAQPLIIAVYFFCDTYGF